MLAESQMNLILNDMADELNSEQLRKLKCSIIMRTSESTLSTEILLPNEINDRYLSMYEIALRVENKSPKTIYQYIRATRKLFDYFNMDFRLLQYEHAMIYLASLYKTKNSPTSIDNCRKFIKTFFNWAMDNDYIVKNPFDKIKKISRNPIKKDILTDDEIVTIRDYCQGDNRALALVDLLLSTGIRVSECAELKISDIDFSSNKIDIYGKKTRIWRTVYLDANARKHLKRYIRSRKDNNPYLFVTKNRLHLKLCSGAINQILHNVQKNTHTNKVFTVHLFRKTLATKLYNKGMGIQNIATMLGHSSETCLRYYLSIFQDGIKSDYMKYA